MLLLRSVLKFIALAIAVAHMSGHAKTILPADDSPQDRYAREVVTTAIGRALPDEAIEAFEMTAGTPRNSVDSTTVTWQPARNIAADTSQHIVRIPVYRGLMSYYSIISHKPSLFKNDDFKLKNHKVGMLIRDEIAGPLRKQGYKIVQTRALGSLVYMLNKGRFDALLAPASEIADLSISAIHEPPRQVISLYNPYFFVVDENRPDIAAALERELRLMLQDGTLDQLLANTPWMQRIKGHLANHKLLPSPVNNVLDAFNSTEVANEFWLSPDAINNDPKSLLTSTFKDNL